MKALEGVLTAVNYPGSNSGGCQLRSSLPQTRLGSHLDITVGNASALIQLFTLANPDLGIGGDIQISDEFVLVAGTGQIRDASWENCVGFQAKDFISGTHATVYAALYEKGDPNPIGGNAYGGTLTSSGANPAVNNLISQTILATAAANVSFTIPSSFTHIRIEYLAGCDQASDTSLQMVINNDVGANYQWQVIESVNGVATAAGQQAQTAMTIGILGTGANGFYAGTIDIPFYLIGVQKRAVGTFAGTGQSFRAGTAGGGWAGNIISTITLSALVGNLNASSAFSVYGI